MDCNVRHPSPTCHSREGGNPIFPTGLGSRQETICGKPYRVQRKITTRQTIQLHGIVKSKIKPTISAFNKANLDSIATCGDINRNVTCASHPVQSPLHAEIFAYAGKISNLLFPKTKAYYEIWIDDEKIADKNEEIDPLYQDRYLPRKFKIGIGIPPNNEVDVLINDLALIAIIEEGRRDIEKIRTVLSIDNANNSLTFAGNVEEGGTVRFCQATHDRLVDGAGDAAHLVADHTSTGQTGLAVCVSCVGRKGVMAAQVADEIKLVHQILGAQTALTGFYSYGEFAPRPDTSDSVLHNQTMTIGYLSENLLA